MLYPVYSNTMLVSVYFDVFSFMCTRLTRSLDDKQLLRETSIKCKEKWPSCQQLMHPEITLECHKFASATGQG